MRPHSLSHVRVCACIAHGPRVGTHACLRTRERRRARAHTHARTHARARAHAHARTHARTGAHPRTHAHSHVTKAGGEVNEGFTEYARGRQLACSESRWDDSRAETLV
eukprot:6200428-Pleurochrysis_carterae.AAC.1